MDTGELIRNLNGLTKEEGVKLCKDNGYDVRVVKEDSKNYAFTMDLRFNRVNLYIENGMIIKSDIG